MTIKKLTDEEIIKALECCSEPFNECAGCPLYDDYPSCEIHVIDLINRQKAEIKRLQKENNLVSIQFQDLQERINDIKAEAYKEFASRLKCGVPQETGVIRCSDVDNLLKEMAGETK